MKIKLKFLIFIGLMILFYLGPVSNGASSSVSASSKNIKVGDTINVYVNVNGVASWDINVNYSGLSLQSGTTKIVDTSSSGDNVSKQIQNLKFKAPSAGEYTISLSGMLVDENFSTSSASGSVTIIVTEPVVTPPNNGGSGGNTGGTSGGGSSSGGTSGGSTTSKSDNSNLTGISLSAGELIPSFNKNTREYTAYVGNEIQEINISATKENSKATYSITGNKDLKIGENIITITVTAEDGSQKIYKIKVIRAEALALRLSSLSITGYTLEPIFNPEQFEYTLNIDKDIKELEVIAISTSENIPIEITGAKDLKEGQNIISIILKSADGTIIQEYKILVNITIEKQAEEETNKEEEKKAVGLFGGIDFTNIPKDKIFVVAVTIITTATIIMLLVEAYKERLPKSDEKSNSIITAVEKINKLSEEERKEAKHF